MTNLLTWLRSDWTHAFVAIAAFLAAFAATWGAIKAAYAHAVGHPMPRTTLTLTFDVLAELANNALGALNKLLVARGVAPLFPPASPPERPAGGTSTDSPSR